jgi:hypothetical protein
MPLVPFVLAGWIIVALVLYRKYTPALAILIVCIGGELFLPEVKQFAPTSGVPAPLSIPGVKLTKVNVIAYALLLALVVAPPARWQKLRWFDVPMLVWCLCPFASSLSNGLGLYDGASQSLSNTLVWGVPYWVGRLYFTDADRFRTLVIAFILGGLVYVPLCWYEIRMSPQLHEKVYGFYQHEFGQSVRFDGYRPVVFMGHGLLVGMWMAMTSLLAFWMWWSGSVRRISAAGVGLTVSLGWLTLGLATTTVFCKSTGAIMLAIAGTAVLWATRFLRTRVALLLLLLVPPLYVGTRMSGEWSADAILDELQSFTPPDRLDSLVFRFKNENSLVERSWERMVFGWGGWARADEHDSSGKDLTVSDGLWIIALSNRGLVGLVAIFLVLLLPALRYTWLVPVALWPQPRHAPELAAAVILGLVAIDNLLNSNSCSMFVLLGGALASVTAARPTAPARKVNNRVRPMAVLARKRFAPVSGEPKHPRGPVSGRIR